MSTHNDYRPLLIHIQFMLLLILFALWVNDCDWHVDLSNCRAQCFPLAPAIENNVCFCDETKTQPPEPEP